MTLRNTLSVITAPSDKRIDNTSDAAIDNPHVTGADEASSMKWYRTAPPVIHANPLTSSLVNAAERKATPIASPGSQTASPRGCPLVGSVPPRQRRHIQERPNPSCHGASTRSHIATSGSPQSCAESCVTSTPTNNVSSAAESASVTRGAIPIANRASSPTSAVWIDTAPVALAEMSRMTSLRATQS